jgi:SM-20-related protein
MLPRNFLSKKIAPPLPAAHTSQPLLSSDVGERLDLFEVLAQNLVDKGYSVQTNALPNELSQLLWDKLQGMGPFDFHKAGIGRNRKDKVNQLIRNDGISWIEETTMSGVAWLTWITSLQAYLNERLFLGLFSFESHYSRYRKGDFYRKHHDAFLGDDNRKLSIIMYLNKDWLVKDGGELVLYPNEAADRELRVVPEFGTLVVFLSEDVLHEVLPPHCDRYSIAGWFGINSPVTV